VVGDFPVAVVVGQGAHRGAGPVADPVRGGGPQAFAGLVIGFAGVIALLGIDFHGNAAIACAVPPRLAWRLAPENRYRYD
jgi:hypothetical protein